MSLVFVERGHRYLLDGKPIPGVTTLLNKGLPKPALPYWAAKSVAEYVVDDPDGVEKLRQMGRNTAIAALKGVPWERRDKAAVRGTAVHGYGERLVHGEEVEVPDEYHGYVEGYANLLDELGLDPVLTERKVANRRWWYAGSFDLVARIGGETLLLDLKTASSIYGSVACQVAAYAGAEWYVGDDGEETPLPHIDGIGAIHITPEGSRLHRFPDQEAAWKAWLHIAWLANRIPDIDSWGMGKDAA